MKKELEPIYPIGNFVIENAKGTQTSNGMYYHYTDVCSLLIKHKQLREEKTNDEFTIGFAEWIHTNDYIKLDDGNWSNDMMLEYTYSIQELLTRYKNSLKQ